ncbi:efflux RND transporter permease subunit [Acidithiobacillus sp. HP-6]|nr:MULTISPECIES: efflux RND transporter permease subunit [unclassified Acidithiobacillus]MBE7562646.1 efflux RND transporter permease subunit [Acidithiobacillus sp. HP-6]MBE7568281.1 efflux RND transporter permease subunit [Acidithiobacillus sp. HP-2]
MIRGYLRFLWETRYTVFLLIGLLLAAGWIAFQEMPESIFPAVDFPKVSVLVHTNDLPVKFMLLQVTRPLEEAAKGEPGVTLVRSQTGNGLTKLHVYFGPHTNPDLAYLMLQARLSHIVLPVGAKMSVRLMTPNIYPLSEYALVSNHLDSSAMMATFAFSIRPAILSVQGVYHVDDTGRGWPEVHIRLNPQKLAQYHLSAAQVVSALRAQQGPFFSGVLNAFHEQFILATTPRPSDAAHLANVTLPLGRANAAGVHAPIALGALGSIQTGPPPLIRQAAVAGYRHALLMDISAQQGANQVNVSNAVQKRMQLLEAQLPAHMHIVPIYKMSHLIQSSLSDVWIALGLGTGIAFLIVFLFLGRWDGAVATLAVVPLAVAATMLALHALGFGINIMTLGGITAAIGALVDHAIVIVERGIHGLEGDAETRREQALRRIRDILPLMTMATLTSCIIFLPLIFLSGTIGLLFRSMAMAIVIALVTSQIIAVVVTPIFAMWIATRAKHFHRLPGERWLRRHYGRLLVAGMRRPWLAVPVVLVMALVAGIGATQLPTAFLPHWDEGIFVVPYRTPVGSGIGETMRVGRDFMRIALENPNVERVDLVAGRGLGNAYATPNKGALTILLKAHRTQSTEVVMRSLRHKLRKAAPDLTTLETMQVMINRLGNLSGSHAPLVIKLFGSSSAILHKVGLHLTNALEASHDFQSIVLKSPSAGPELAIHPSALANMEEFTPQTLSSEIKTRYWGRRAGFLLHGEQILPIRVEVEGSKSRNLANFGGMLLRLPNGTLAPLSQVAHVQPLGMVPYVTHQNLVPYAAIKLSPKAGEGLSQAAARANQIIADAHLPPGVTSHIGGYYHEQQKSFQQMTVILIGALLILLILLGFQFGSQKAATVAIFSIALAAPGALILLMITHTALDSTAFLGILLVFAIAVNNVILVFARARQLDGNHPRPASVVFAAHQRLRPILMTMLADVFGFLPLAIGIGRGTDLLQPLAISVMGGLALGTVMTLWLAPVLYVAWTTKRPKISN